MQLGEYIRWSPMGAGGDPAMSLQGAFEPGVFAVTSLRQKQRRMQLRRERRQTYKDLRGLGNYTRWAPLGPGGDPQMSLQGLSLGVLGPESQTDLDARMAQLIITDEQVYNEIAEANASGADAVQIEGYNLRYDGLYERLLQPPLAGPELSEDDWPRHQLFLETLQEDYESLLQELFNAREGRRFGTAATGLAWGLGTAAVVGGGLWLVWRNRAKGRRR